ncbi:helix-turn-helix transcriptional regulator [Mucilaginibacter sp. L196]|uniref:helix-turn-helix transcriptional regulator n=1 Tax=Mucilaginibacter sp. L196 TaxID=1641870 RepID=UPI00131B1677|nr:helix-turn-helix transcriptional regulator [Mucilaginibacter sp. L196]
MEKSSIDWYSMSDKGVLNLLGQFIQETRLQQNKTQQQVADSAGINRSTVSQIEKGNGGTLLSFLQILRVLEQLPVLQSFETEQKISPLQIAKLEQQKRQRARNNDNPNHITKVNW